VRARARAEETAIMIKRVVMIGMLGTRIGFAMKKTGKASCLGCYPVLFAAFLICIISRMP
jgi:hypothetical protein